MIVLLKYCLHVKVFKGPAVYQAKRAGRVSNQKGQLCIKPKGPAVYQAKRAGCVSSQKGRLCIKMIGFLYHFDHLLNSSKTKLVRKVSNLGSHLINNLGSNLATISAGILPQSRQQSCHNLVSNLSDLFGEVAHQLCLLNYDHQNVGVLLVGYPFDDQCSTDLKQAFPYCDPHLIGLVSFT